MAVRKGFFMVGLMVALALVPVLALVSLNFFDASRSADRIARGATARATMEAAKVHLVAAAADVDGDGRFELLAPGAGATLPLVIPVGADPWGTPLRYCAWDLGALNAADPEYTNNNVAPPAASLAGRVISAGHDREFQTSCSAAGGAGDDLVVEIFEADVLFSHGAVGGWVDEGSIVRLINPADQVRIGNPEASAHKVDVEGSVRAELLRATSNATADTFFSRAVFNDYTLDIGIPGQRWGYFGWSPAQHTSGGVTQHLMNSVLLGSYENRPIVIQPGGDGGNATTAIMGGNVGLGTVLPNAKLHVVGTMRATGLVTAEGDIRAQRFVDQDNTSFLVDPASTSAMNRVQLTYSATAANDATHKAYVDQAAGLNNTGSATITPTATHANAAFTELFRLTKSYPGGSRPVTIMFKGNFSGGYQAHNYLRLMVNGVEVDRVYRYVTYGDGHTLEWVPVMIHQAVLPAGNNVISVEHQGSMTSIGHPLKIVTF